MTSQECHYQKNYGRYYFHSKRAIDKFSSKIFLILVSVIPVPRFLQLYCRGYLEDSRSFNKDPPHLTLNHGFLVIWLSEPKKVA